MAVLTYTVSVADGVAELTPDPTKTLLLDRDFVIFKLAKGTSADVKVKVLGGGLPEISIVIDDQDPPNALRLKLQPPTIEPDGSVLITFGAAGGASGGFPPG